MSHDGVLKPAYVTKYQNNRPSPVSIAVPALSMLWYTPCSQT